MSDEHLTSRDVSELRRLARSRPQDGRGRLAKLGAIRTLERLDREAARRARLQPDFEYPWDGEDPELMWSLYARSEVERALFGALRGPHGRPDDERQRIAEVVDQLERDPDPAGAFRRWRDGLASDPTIS